MKRLVCAALLACAVGCGEAGERSETSETRPMRFSEIAEESGIRLVSEYRSGPVDLISETIGGGAAWFDADNDGDWDLYIASGRGHPNGLFLNNGDGTFRENARNAGVDHRGASMGAAAADYNGDGRVDLFVSNYGETDTLYRNEGNGVFSDATDEAGVGGTPGDWSTSAAWGDIDNDGDLDLYVARYLQFDEKQAGEILYPAETMKEPPTLAPGPYPPQANALYRNEGNGAFVEIAGQAGVANPRGKSLGAVFCDIDNDGDLDLFAANDVTPNALFKNNGDGTFEDVSFLAGMDDPRQGMGVDFGDFDGDGDFDLFVTYWIDEMNGLYRNNLRRREAPPSDSFDDIAPEVGLGAPSVGFTGWGTVFSDFDLDGDLDIFAVNGHTSPAPDNPRLCAPQRDQLFRNDGGKYADAPDALPFEDWGAARGLAAADIDNDGDEDLLVVQNNGPALLFRNESGGRNRCVKIRAPVGSRIEARIGKRWIVREIRAGSSYLSTNAPEAVVAAPPGGQLDEIRCRGVSVRNVPAGSSAVFYADGSPPVIRPSAKTPLRWTHSAA